MVPTLGEQALCRLALHDGCGLLPRATLDPPTSQLCQHAVQLRPHHPLMPLRPLHPPQDLSHLPVSAEQAITKNPHHENPFRSDFSL